MLSIPKLRDFLNSPSITSCCFLLFFAVPVVGAELEVTDYRGWVMTVFSGDTIRVLDGSNRMTRVRLKSIDAPEKGQAFSEESRKHLASLLVGREVKIKANKTDEQGNILGQVWTAPAGCDGCKESVDVNLAQVQAGLAWWASAFAKQQSRRDRKAYESAEQAARAKKLGLWSEPAPVPPWSWQDGESRPESTPED